MSLPRKISNKRQITSDRIFVIKASTVSFFLLFLFLNFFFLVKLVRAQNPPGNVPCDKVRDPEFHSLRPYQANPCDDEVHEDALFCGNQLVISDTVSALQTTPPTLADNCAPISADKYRCTYKVAGKTRSIAIDLSGAELPIMGNTELVVNSQNNTDQLDDAEKTNEYVSWYLNGVINRPEYSPLDPESAEDISKIVNFSGPLNKLLPWEIQVQNRIATIDRAKEKKQHNQIVGCTTVLGKPISCKDTSFLDKKLRLADWKGGRLPPLREEYGSFNEYRKAYEEWRGKRCIYIPFTDRKLYFCFDDPTRPNYWADLFPNIPFSSTEDRIGLVETSTFGIQPASENLEITNVSFSNQEPAELFFPHMQEASELADQLQNTFVPAGMGKTGGATGVSPVGYCDLANVRTNPGDDLFAGEIGGVLSYDAEFSCDFDKNATESACLKEALVSLSVLTKTPKADEVWERTVAGPSAIFKRIFPKVGPGGAILGILDIPAATKVTYTGVDFAGNPGNQRSGEGAELYFPHIGGVSEYFLKGIQTILRPKGFGEQILSGALGTFPSSGEVDCDQSAADVSLRGTLDKQATFQLALNWVAGQTGNHVLECYNDVVKRSRETGVNAALSLWLWLHESNASNYNISDEDFGVHTGKPKGFVAQINGFFARAKNPVYSASSSLCQGTGVTNDLQAWALIYKSGNCDPKGEGASFYEELVGKDGVQGQWRWVSPGCPLPSSPTDTGCP